MDYAYRRTPEMGRPEYYRPPGPPPPEQQGGPAGPRGREYSERSRSQGRVDPEFIPTDVVPFNRPLDKTNRSKSLDYRDGFRDDVYFEDRRGGVNIPIRQERKEARNYDYEKEYFVPTTQVPRDSHDSFLDRDRTRDTREPPRENLLSRSYGREVEIPLERVPRNMTRSTEWLDRRPYEERERRWFDRHSPKSVASSKKPQPLNQSFDASRGRRLEQQSEYRRGEEWKYGDGRDAARPEWTDRNIGRSAGGGGGGHRSHHQSSYQYESHGGNAAAGGSPPRRIITQQPIAAISSSNMQMGGPGPGPAAGIHQTVHHRPPIQYRRVRCCCFEFTWPPWSYEPTTPPQPIYRNI